MKCHHMASLKTVSEGKDDEEAFLPNLPDELSGEQLLVQQYVFRANEIFIKKHNYIDKWLNSPPESRVYPMHAQNNKTAYKKKASNYICDSSKGILYKRIKNVEGVGE